MPERLLPLTALRAFDAAARHMSFAKAAEELFVTPAALSYQIKQLEEHLGTPLFLRLNRAVELTEAGRALLPGTTEGFDNLRDAVRAVARLQEDTALSITAGPAFTAKWLAPRFFRFANEHPEIELRFVATLRIMDFHRDGIDAAIRFGHEVADNEYAEVLAEEWMTPVCTPATAEVIARDGISAVPLLHDESIEFLDPAPTWRAWSEATGIKVDWSHGQHFTNADHAIDFAQEGGGIVLGRVVLVERYLETGRMVAPFPIAMRAGAQFRFVCPKGAETTPRIATLLGWIRDEMACISKLSEGMDFVDLPGT
ncbi:MAG: transcriptional regulator GcvA [Paracoccaceae bacterium]